MIVSLGFLHNIASLLASSGDDISDKSGRDLVRDKVSSIFIMGGSYPRSLVPSFNFGCADGLMGEAGECGGSAQAAVSLMPPEVRLVYSGFTPGFLVRSGGALTDCATPANPCRQAYIDYLGEGWNRSEGTSWHLVTYDFRMSWDPLTLVAAVRGAAGIRLEEIGHSFKQFTF